MNSRTNLKVAERSEHFRFEGLSSYTREEVTIWNWCRRFLRGAPEWQSWIQESWGGLLDVPAGVEICLTQKHSVDAQEPGRKHTFKQREISIGRQPDNDLTVPTQSAGNRHARVFVENGRCFIEDLGSSLGTYLNQSKLYPKHPSPLRSGDQFAIFPYVFSVSIRQLWARQIDVGVYSATAEPMSWQTFLDTSTKGRTSFSIDVHPIGTGFCLEVGRAFLIEFVDRLLRPLELEWPPSALSAPDNAFLEFLIVCLLERVNCDLAFPFQFETGLCDSKPQFGPETRGVVIACSLNVLTTTGALRIFAPYSLLHAMRHVGPELGSEVPAPAVTWNFPVSVGHAHLSAREISGLEREDVILLELGVKLHFPGRHDCGWRLAGASEVITVTTILQTGNLPRLQIDKYFERELSSGGGLQMSEYGEPSRTPDISQLPVRVDVILAEKELTLSEANNLVSGTILELDGENNGHVSLAVNGKIVGQGQLVDVEGRLGVKILGWKHM